MSSAMHVPCVKTGFGEFSTVFASDLCFVENSGNVLPVGSWLLVVFLLGELLVIARMTDADSSRGSAGVTDADSSAVCGKRTCEDVACFGGAAGSSGTAL